MVAGRFSFGNPDVPCLNKMDHFGNNDPFWDPAPIYHIDNCRVSSNFLRTNLGYRVTTLLQIDFEGQYSVDPALPDYGDWEFLGSGPSGWVDEGDTVYVAALYYKWNEDTVQYRNLLKFYPDGTLDTAFQHVEGINPFFGSPTVSTQIYPYDEDRILLNGGFDYVQGHYTPRLCRLFKDGRIDTTFSSGLNQEARGWPMHVDSQGRILTGLEISGNQVPSDSLEAFRLMPDGSLDPTWNPIDLATSLSFSGAGGVPHETTIPLENGGYILGGRFNYVNGIPRSSIVQVDSVGNVVEGVFEGRPFYTDETIGTFYPDTISIIYAIEPTPDGGLLVGGRFSHFRGEPHASLVKLIPDSTVSTQERTFEHNLKIWPNPAKDSFRIRIKEGNGSLSAQTTIVLRDLMGRVVYQQIARSLANGEEVNVAALAPGVYLCSLEGEGKVLGVEKLVVN
jgi:hypothetical protein